MLSCVALVILQAVLPFALMLQRRGAFLEEPDNTKKGHRRPVVIDSQKLQAFISNQLTKNVKNPFSLGPYDNFTSPMAVRGLALIALKEYIVEYMKTVSPTAEVDTGLWTKLLMHFYQQDLTKSFEPDILENLKKEDVNDKFLLQAHCEKMANRNLVLFNHLRRLKNESKLRAALKPLGRDGRKMLQDLVDQLSVKPEDVAEDSQELEEQTLEGHLEEVIDAEVKTEVEVTPKPTMAQERPKKKKDLRILQGKHTLLGILLFQQSGWSQWNLRTEHPFQEPWGAQRLLVQTSRCRHHQPRGAHTKKLQKASQV